MKAKVASLLAVLLLTTTQCMAQKRITVEAESYDISNNLDLQAVASVFGESDNLQEFEMKLNDFDSKISNLDLNNDGEVDYLRVIESSENNIHVVVVQAVLDRDVFQDVATIVVEKNRNRRTYVQVIGDPYLYGTNYIIEPVYVYTPHIFSFFWGSNYYRWNSPYYWGYYPSYYRNRNPYEVNIYLSNVNRHVNHDHRYYYTERYRNDYALKLHDRVSRNDYGKKYPDRTFSDRNKDVRNKQEFDNKRSGGERGITTRTSYQGNEAGRRSTENTSGTRTSRGQNDNRNSNSTINTNPNTGSRNTNSGVNDRMTQPRTSTPTSTSRGSEINREQRQTETSRPATNSNRETYQTPSSTNSNSGSRNNNAVTRDNNSRNSSATPVVRENNSRPTPTVSQPSSRSTDSKPADRKPAESTRSNDDKTERGSRSSDSNSNRR
jgi:hypothetical protein